MTPPSFSLPLFVSHKKGDTTEYGNYGGISLVPYAGKVLLNVLAENLPDSCEAKGLLPEQGEFRSPCWTMGMMFVVRRL